MGRTAVILSSHATLAFLVFDLFMRHVPVETAKLEQTVRHWSWMYACAAGVAMVAGVLTQVGSPGWIRLLSAGIGGLLWWMLWRFGMRKQFTFLFEPGPAHPTENDKPRG